MEIYLNKVFITEESGFVNFSIREYVAEIRKKDKKKCWPFGSLGDPEKDEDFVSYQSAKSTCRKCPGDIDGSDVKAEYTEAPNSSKVGMLNGKEDLSEDMKIASLGINDNLGKGVCNGSSESASNKVNNDEYQHENNVNEDAKSGCCGDVYIEPGRNQTQKKPQKIRLLSDISRDLSGPSSVPCVHSDRNNINSRFSTKTEDELDDDITLDAVFKKRKNKRVEEPRSVENKKSKNRSKDMKVEVNGRLDTKTEDELDDNVTLDAIFRKRKGADEVTPPLKKKWRKVGVGTQKDFPVADCKKSNINTEVGNSEATETEKNDSEMEAVMLLARHFNEEKVSTDDGIPVEIGRGCACVQKKLKEQLNESISKPATKHPAGKFPKEKVESAFCWVNRNPADFSIPNAENKFMRGG